MAASDQQLMSLLDPPKGLQRFVLSGLAALSTLGGNTALTVANLDNFTVPFLAKKIRGYFIIEGLTDGEFIEIVIGRGDSSLAEIADALQLINVDPLSNPDAYQIEQNEAIKHVWWETKKVLVSGPRTGSDKVEFEMSLGGGKGIPISESNGISCYAFNTLSSALTTGGIVSVGMELVGVWLG